jgi:uncharacterized integral membrane protein (TIGR00698 family)
LKEKDCSCPDDSAWCRHPVQLLTGLAIAGAIALAALSAGVLLGGAPALYAILGGLALCPFVRGATFKPGLDFAAGTLLRAAIALLGARVSLHQIVALGFEPIAIIVPSILVGVALVVLAARWLGLGAEFGLIAGMAVAICGVSAALTAATLLPRSSRVEGDVLLVSLVVTVLSTVAMIVYPLVGETIGLNQTGIGIFLGATIHDLAQVVGAGFGVSLVTGNAAVITKLIRISMLPPTVILIGWLMHRSAPRETAAIVPWFIVVFVLLAFIQTAGFVPSFVSAHVTTLSNFAFTAAVAAIGLKSSMEISWGNWRCHALIVAHTFLLAAVVAAILVFL